MHSSCSISAIDIPHISRFPFALRHILANVTSRSSSSSSSSSPCLPTGFLSRASVVFVLAMVIAVHLLAEVRVFEGVGVDDVHLLPWSEFVELVCSEQIVADEGSELDWHCHDSRVMPCRPSSLALLIAIGFFSKYSFSKSSTCKFSLGSHKSWAGPQPFHLTRYSSFRPRPCRRESRITSTSYSGLPLTSSGGGSA